MNLITRGFGKSQGLITQGIGAIVAKVLRGVRSATRGGLLKKKNVIDEKKPEEKKQPITASTAIDTNLIRVTRRWQTIQVRAEVIQMGVKADLVSVKSNPIKQPIIEATYGTV